jgi:4'-phosphopantetheinyl transferase
LSGHWAPGPAQPTLSRAKVHVWRVDLGARRWPGPKRLPREERERAEALLRPAVAERWVAARWALRHVLAGYLEEDPGQVAIAVDAGGKPRLAEDPERLRFNLSHSGALALVAISAENEVGADVEEARVDRDPVALAEQALTSEDIEAIRNAAPAERAEVFHRRWARHEARLKCLGVGIFGGTPPAAEVAVQDLDAGSGYAAAVAIAAPEMPPLRCWTFDPGALRNDGNRVS